MMQRPTLYGGNSLRLGLLQSPGGLIPWSVKGLQGPQTAAEEKTQEIKTETLPVHLPWGRVPPTPGSLDSHPQLWLFHFSRWAAEAQRG